MNYEKVVLGFFIVLTLALNLGFVVGEIDNASHHSIWMLFAALMVGWITTGLKLGDRSHLGAMVLSSGLVANLLLMVAISVWAIGDGSAEQLPQAELMTTIVSLAYGALSANIVSVLIVVSDSLMSRR